MIIGTCRIYLSAGWITSLKEKRSVVKGIIGRAGNKFNISIAEIERMDEHRSIVIGFACVSNETRHVNSVITNVVSYIENGTEAVVEDVVIEIL